MYLLEKKRDEEGINRQLAQLMRLEKLLKESSKDYFEKKLKIEEERKQLKHNKMEHLSLIGGLKAENELLLLYLESLHLSYSDQTFSYFEKFDLSETMSELRKGPDQFYSDNRDQIDKVLKSNSVLTERIEKAKQNLKAKLTEDVLKARSDFQREQAQLVCQELKNLIENKPGKEL